jgi:hypothetical protein
MSGNVVTVKQYFVESLQNGEIDSFLYLTAGEARFLYGLLTDRNHKKPISAAVYDHKTRHIVAAFGRLANVFNGTADQSDPILRT